MNKTLLLWTTGDFHGPHLPHEHPGGTHRWVRTYVWYQGHCQRAPLAQGNDTKRLYLAMMNSCVMLPWLGLAAAQLDSSHSSTSQVTLPILFPHLLSRCSHIWEHLLSVLPQLWLSCSAPFQCISHLGYKPMLQPSLQHLPLLAEPKLTSHLTSLSRTSVKPNNVQISAGQ